jgi:hypothetical protein
MFLLSAAFFIAAPGGAAGLPEASQYRGEIRRGPDGKLMVVEPAKTAGGAAAGQPATMRVGPAEKVRTISEAARLARDGEVIEIQPGEYHGEPAVWTQDRLTIRGAPGARPRLFADGAAAEEKALWVVRGGAVRVENLEFRGARVPDGNGAGIRFERGRLNVHRCAFIDNEMGILTANDPALELEVSDSEFSAAPRHEGALHHLLYVGGIGRFTLTGSRFSNGYRGHLVKSRARVSRVRYNLLADGADGRASYELEFPNGGFVVAVGNVIAQSAGSENAILVSYGAEGPRWPENALYFAHNTLVNARPDGGTYVKLWPEKLAGAPAFLINNLTVGAGDFYPPPLGRFEGNASAPERALISYAGLPLRLKPDDPRRGSVRVPGDAPGESLLPDAEFTLPAGARPIHPAAALAPGAFQ